MAFNCYNLKFYSFLIPKITLLTRQLEGSPVLGIPSYTVAKWGCTCILSWLLLLPFPSQTQNSFLNTTNRSMRCCFWHDMGIILGKLEFCVDGNSCLVTTAVFYYVQGLYKVQETIWSMQKWPLNAYASLGFLEY